MEVVRTTPVFYTRSADHVSEIIPSLEILSGIGFSSGTGALQSKNSRGKLEGPGFYKKLRLGVFRKDMPQRTGFTMTGNAVNLIAFGSRQESCALGDILNGLGYEVRQLDESRWLAGDRLPDNYPYVLLISEPQPPCRRISICIAGIHAPCLAILPKNPRFHDSDIATECTEFVHWPCARWELDIRLARLHNLVVDSTLSHPRASPKETTLKSNMIGQSAAFKRLIAQLEKIAICEAPVLMEGETGTGKELAALAIHYNGHRRNQPFIPVNCGALPDNLIENELFGHERGAYTDARSSHPGLVAQADGGTLFLDEIEALSNKGQVTLLRFLESKEYRPLGSRRIVSGNIRLIAASNTNLAHLRDQGLFRQDLFFRLNILPVHLPPLRERQSDIALLANYFVKVYSRKYGLSGRCLHPDALMKMQAYPWPGNVRELEHLIHRELLLSSEPAIHCRSLEPVHEEPPALMPPHEEDVIYSLDFKEAKARLIAAFEKRYLILLLAETRGNVTLAAKRAGKERRAFGKLLKKHGIERVDYVTER